MHAIKKHIIPLALLLLLTLLLVSCGKSNLEGIWEEAKYTEDMTFGEGAKTVQVEIKANGESITFTLKSDKTYLGDALDEHGLIEWENGAYGRYLIRVNGMLADFNKTGTYWAIYKDGKYANAGVDALAFVDGEHYELVAEKG